MCQTVRYDETLQLIFEMNRWTWHLFKEALNDVTPEEVNWQPLPQANSINLIVRHLRIEAEWHVASLEHGDPMAKHWGQICTIRNLYRKTRGEAARFFPDNPTFP